MQWVNHVTCKHAWTQMMDECRMTFWYLRPSSLAESCLEASPYPTKASIWYQIACVSRLCFLESPHTAHRKKQIAGNLATHRMMPLPFLLDLTQHVYVPYTYLVVKQSYMYNRTV